MTSFQSKDIIAGIQKQIKRLVHRWYSVGNVVHIEQSFAGYVNKSFAVWIEKNGSQTKYLLRQYNPGIKEAEIRFEHALIRHLRDNAFTQAADVISSRDGRTFVCRDDSDTILSLRVGHHQRTISVGQANRNESLLLLRVVGIRIRRSKWIGKHCCGFPKTHAVLRLIASGFWFIPLEKQHPMSSRVTSLQLS